MSKVKIPTAFRRYTDGHRHVEIDARTVGQLLGVLADQYPELRSHLFDEGGKLLSFVNVFVNDQNIRDLDGDASELADRDEVFLVPAMAGG